MKKKTQAKRIYNYLNEVYFDGVLPAVTFKFINDLDYIAACASYGKKHPIEMEFSKGKYYHYDHAEIMLHEMCHVWQYHTGGKDNHGKSFKEIALDISQRSGYTIEKYQEYFSFVTEDEINEKKLKKTLDILYDL